MYEEYKDKYPEWFDKEGNYIQGSIENHIERIKDSIREEANKKAYGQKSDVNVEELQTELSELSSIPMNITEEKVKALFFRSEIPKVINTYGLSDKEALEVKDFYPTWQSFINKELPKGYKVTFMKSGETEPTLYKVIQTVATVLEHQTPDLVPSNYEVIDETHAGTIEDPIPYKQPMTVYNGKYYSYNKVLYKCTRDSLNPLQYNPDVLVGHYFEIVKQ